MSGSEVPDWGQNAREIDRNTLMAAARSRICHLGDGDHGHTDCWITSGLLTTIESQATEITELSLSRDELTEALAEAQRQNAALTERTTRARSTDQSKWGVETGITCVSCPDCAFTFDSMHHDPDGNYSCPNCFEHAYLPVAAPSPDTEGASE